MIELTGHKGPVVALAYSPDGRTLASASADGTARLWDLATGKLTATLQSPAARAYCVAFAPDGKSLAVGYGGPQGLVQIWNTDPLERRDSWVADPATLRGVAFSLDAKMLAMAGSTWGVKLHGGGLPTTRRLTTFKLPVAAVAFSPDGQFVSAVTLRCASVRMWRVSDASVYRSQRLNSDWGYALSFAPERNCMAFGLEHTVALWDPADYRPPHVWAAHAGAVLGVAFTPDGDTLLTGGADGLVKLWDPAGRLRHTFDWKIREVGAVAFAPDGLTAAAGGAETILVWDVAG